MGLPEFLSRYGTAPVFPDIAGSYRGGVIVCGDAECVWDDLDRFDCRSGNGVAKSGWDFCTVNRLVETFPGKIEHCYSNVAKVLQRHIACRRDEYADEFGPPRHTHSRTEGTKWVWPWHGGGTSGLGAILTMLACGYETVVLAGMPLDNSPHNGEPWWRKTRFASEVRELDPEWQHAIDLAFDRKVTSLSGRTATWLGFPN
jgi:hypothetical protein